MKTVKTISIGALIRRSFQLIRQDYVVLLPYLISSFIIVIISSSFINEQALDLKNNVSIELLFFSALGWIFSLLAQATTVFMSGKLLEKKVPDIAESFILALKNFPKLGALILIAMFCLGSIGVVLSQLLKNYFAYLTLPLLLFVLVLSYLFPVIILSESTPFWKYFKTTFYFIKNNFRNFIRFFLGILTIYLFTILCIALITSAKLTGQEIISPLLQGLSGALMTILTVFFYKETRSTISVNV